MRPRLWPVRRTPYPRRSASGSARKQEKRGCAAWPSKPGSQTCGSQRERQSISCSRLSASCLDSDNEPPDEDLQMITAFVTFRYGEDFDAARVRRLAENSRAKFEGMPGLR